MEFLLLEGWKNRIKYICIPNILNLQPRTIGNKRKYKEIESDSPNKSPKRIEKCQKMNESKESGRTVALMIKKNAKKLKIPKVDIPIVNN